MRATTFALLSVTLASVLPAQQFKNPDNLGPDIPTPETIVDEMLKIAKLRPGELVYDLGCGDGRILIAAVERFNARAVGIEMSRDLFEKTTGRIRSLGLQDRITVIHGNALHTDLSPADVVTMYLLTSSNDRLKPSLEKLHPGARVISHDYEIPGWRPATVKKVQASGRVHTIYAYEIAATR